MKKLSESHEKAIREVCQLFDDPCLARMIINEAVEKGNERVREFGIRRLLKEQKELREIRNKMGQKSPLAILRVALDMLPDTRASGVGSSTSGFNFLLWQEVDGPWR